MKRIGWALGLVLISGCTTIPNLGGGEVLRGTVSASGSDVKIAVVRGAGTDLSGAEVVSVQNGSFSYLLPTDADTLTVVAFRDTNGNGKYDEGEPNSGQNLADGNSYLVLSRVSDKWEITQHTGGGTSQSDNLASANLALG